MFQKDLVTAMEKLRIGNKHTGTAILSKSERKALLKVLETKDLNSSVNKKVISTSLKA